MSPPGSVPLRIVIDRELCAACDICCETAPHTFEIDTEAKSRVKDPEGDPRELIIKAAEGCPMIAITVFDGESGAKLAPGSSPGLPSP